MKVAPLGSVQRWLAVSTTAVLLACGGATGVTADDTFPPIGKRWFDRATASYRAGDIEDAQIAIDNALRVAERREDVRLLGARIALAALDYARVTQLLTGIEGAEASGIRSRALWYSGQVDKAADELDVMLADPEVRDAWATEVQKLARRGSGRKPFQMSGGLLAVSEMPQVSGTWLVVPVEVNGEPALGVLATATAETVIDSSGGAEASWISLRFGERVEVKDVPALAKDLSGLSRQLNAPVKVLLGVNLLRHLRPTFDFLGSQFVVRTYEPPPPPAATTVRVNYVRGGGMLVRPALGASESAPLAAMMVDTSLAFPLALGEGGWKKAGIKPSTLKPLPGEQKLKQGVLPNLRVGAFDIPEVPALYGFPVGQMSDELKIDLDGVVGSGLLAHFRITLIDRGLAMWVEDLPSEAMIGRAAAAAEADDGEGEGEGEASAPAPSSSSAPAPATSAR